MEGVFLGIDIGTTNIKLVAAKSDLSIIYDRSFDYQNDILPNGWLEVSPQIWLDIIYEAIDELLVQCPCQFQAIGLTGQMHTTVFLDRENTPIRPAILWNDLRTREVLPKIKQILLEQTESPQLASIVSNGSPLANLYWLMHYEKENFKRLHRVMMPLNYVNYMLSGQESMDYCDASTTSLYDLEKRDWSHSVFDFFGWDVGLFPPLRAASEVIGFLKENLMERWNQINPVAIVTGTGDNIASALATGSFKTGQPVLSLGTSGVVVIPDSYPHFKKVGKTVLAEISQNDQTMITQGTVQSGAKINSWWIESVIGESDVTKLQQSIPIEQLGKNSVIFVPHMNGEKTLFANPDIRGSFLGLGLETTSSDMYLAILEGLAFGLKSVLDSMITETDFQFLTIVGGGAKSTLWLDIFANVFNKPIRKQSHLSEAVHGALRLAMMSQGYTETAVAEKFVEVLPKKELVARYDRQFNRYQIAVDMVVDFTNKTVNL